LNTKADPLAQSEFSLWTGLDEQGATTEVFTPLLSKIGVTQENIDDLVVAIRASIGGALATKTHYGTSLKVRNKGGGEPVTEADYASNQAILQILQESCPEDLILSEESTAPSKVANCGRMWIVDPLDGTKEFIAQNGEFSIMVGLAREGRSFLGAVCQPTIGRVFAGLAEEGAWTLYTTDGEWNVDQLEVTSTPNTRGPLRFVRSRSHPNECLASIARELGDIKEVISGSVGVKCGLVSRGIADLYVHPTQYLKEWDTCAPEAILRGAGGLVTDCAGKPLLYGDNDPHQHGGIFAGTPAAWHRAQPVVRRMTRFMFADVAGS